MINIYEIKIKIKCLSFDFMNNRYVDNMSTHFPIRYIDFLYTEFREFMRLRPQSWCHIKNYKIFIKFITIHYLDKFLKEYIGVLDQQDLYYILSKLNNNPYYTLEELNIAVLPIIYNKSNYDIPKSDLNNAKLLMTKLKYNLYNVK